MVKIALCMIVGEDYEGLQKALTSAAGMYDHLSICVVEHNGYDIKKVNKVYSIIEAYKAEESTYIPKWDKPFIDDFSAARNFCIDNVPNDTDWIFILDTDDRVVDPFKARSAIISHDPDVVLMGRVQHMEKRNSFMQWRAWPKDSAHFEGPIHNQLVVHEDMDAKYVPELHITFVDRSFGDRYQRNMAILNSLTGEAWKPEHNYYKGEMLFLKAKRDKTIKEEAGESAAIWFEKALKEEVEDSLAYRCHYHLADYYAIMASEDKSNVTYNLANKHINEMLLISPYPREPFYLMGRLMASVNKHNYAVVWLKMCVDMPEHVTVWHMAKDIKAPAYEQLALSYLSLKDYQNAVQYHATAKWLSPTFKSTDHYFEGLITK